MPVRVVSLTLTLPRLTVSLAASPVVLPVKSMNGDGDLEDAYGKAKLFVSKLTLPELFVSFVICT